MATWPAKTNYATGDVLTATQMNDIGGELNDLYTATNNRNPILNSNFSVWQRGTSFTVGAASPYTADRWQANRSGLATGLTVSRQVTNDTVNLPFIQYCSRVQRDSGNTSTAATAYWQNLETVNSIPFAGKQVTLSFYARAGANYSASSNILNVILYSGTGTDQNVNISGFTGSAQVINSNVTLTTTWQRFTYTGTVAATATQLASVFFAYPTGTAGVNDYYEVTGVQLELGSVATSYKPNASTYQGELAACQRYYWRYGGQNVNQRFGMGTAASTTSAYCYVQFPVPMRIAPSTIDYSTLGLGDAVNATVAITSISAVDSSNQGSSFNCGVASGLTQYRPYQLTTNGSLSGYLGISAEL